jgi:hypothetical protein
MGAVWRGGTAGTQTQPAHGCTSNAKRVRLGRPANLEIGGGHCGTELARHLPTIPISATPVTHQKSSKVPCSPSSVK